MRAVRVGDDYVLARGVPVPGPGPSGASPVERARPHERASGDPADRLVALSGSPWSQRRRARWTSWGFMLVVVWAVPETAAVGHEQKAVGSVHVAIGWREEPAYAGLANAVEVSVSDAAGRGVADPGASLRVQVSFGSAATTVALSPTDVAGVYRAPIVPTRPGIYTFELSGSVAGQAIDATSTCSEQTFHCVVALSEVQFPSADPSPSELATRVERSLPRAERAVSDAADGRALAFGALGVAVVALLAAVGALAARRDRPGPRS